MLGGRPSSDAAIGAPARSCLTLSLCRLQGSARVIRCLQESREQLSFECRAALFDQEQDMAEDIDFKFPLRAACASEIPAFCKDVRHGHARIVRCLQVRNSSRALSGLLWTSRRAVGALHVAGRSWRPLEAAPAEHVPGLQLWWRLPRQLITRRIAYCKAGVTEKFLIWQIYTVRFDSSRTHAFRTAETVADYIVARAGGGGDGQQVPAAGGERCKPALTHILRWKSHTDCTFSWLCRTCWRMRRWAASAGSRLRPTSSARPPITGMLLSPRQHHRRLPACICWTLS